ncbi:PIG-L family deacetylase [Persicobacter diffluens]|uniref:GlcNAc-PI de-N-acetylase n=1 Tax=Persicobacter diffluens TaxID=981 RepID=A0AAN4VZP5_9BACT|nr:GlcNAc-PI de-N-acetylase [Persicobacter diffluens]
MPKAITFFCLCFLSLFGFAQTKSAAELQLQLQKLPVAARVLYMAAHPDDENTRLISYLNNVEHIETAYLSLTRGDGGQNLIGPEIWEGLGLIRTQELIAARGVDHGQQFFSRAYDFGYSKHPDETFGFWDRAMILGDVVKVIREFRPDVIITRFPTTPGITHGHHTASAILALEGVEASADPRQFREWGAAHQVKRVLWNTSSWFYRDHPKDFEALEVLELNIGKYLPLQGQSVAENAALSRSQHKSQGFGSKGAPGEMMEYLVAIDGQATPDEILAGLELSWSRFEGGKSLDKKVANLVEEFQPMAPWKSVPDLLTLKEDLENLPSSFWRDEKIKEVESLIFDCSGLYAQVLFPSSEVFPGEEINLQIKLSHPSNLAIGLESILLSGQELWAGGPQDLIQNELFTKEVSYQVETDKPFSQPYWLANSHGLGNFEVDDVLNIGKADSDPSFKATAQMKINGTPFSCPVPVLFESSDPVKGLIQKPVYNVPKVEVAPAVEQLIFDGEKLKALSIKLTAKVSTRGYLGVQTPAGWEVIMPKGEIEIGPIPQEVVVRVKAPDSADFSALKFYFEESNGQTYTQYVQRIAYDHIPIQIWMHNASVVVKKINLAVPNRKVAYLQGAGDVIPEALKEVGMPVAELDAQQPSAKVLSGYDVVILGVRALNTLENMPEWSPLLKDFVAKGGTVITQYNTSFRLKDDDFAPYPLKLGRSRVTNEQADVQILSPQHPVLTNYNQISQDDFDGWVQERGLYFPQEWDERYEPILSMHDEGEDALNSSLLVAPYGKGVYVYTSLSFFRELPAGVPGAYRLFMNIIGLEKNQFKGAGK